MGTAILSVPSATCNSSLMVRLPRIGATRPIPLRAKSKAATSAVRESRIPGSSTLGPQLGEGSVTRKDLRPACHTALRLSPIHFDDHE